MRELWGLDVQGGGWEMGACSTGKCARLNGDADVLQRNGSTLRSRPDT